MINENNKWYQRLWLPFAAFVYIFICIFDFVVMPVYVTAHNSRIENEVFRTLQGKDAIAFADAMAKTNQAARQWNPLTLLGAGMFHLAFGALLTGGAVTRGFAKKSEIEGYYRYGPAGYDQEGSPGVTKMSYNYGYAPYSHYPENPPYAPNRPGAYNGAQNPRMTDAAYTDENGPVRKTTDLDT